MVKTLYVFVIVWISLLSVKTEAGVVSGSMEFSYGQKGVFFATPEPRLIRPVSETLDLTGKDTVEFRWSPFEGKIHERRFYEFCLYKGREQVAKNIIVKKKIAADVYSLTLSTDIFEDGQVYTWALRQAFFTQKSDWAYSAFVVIKNSNIQ